MNEDKPGSNVIRIALNVSPWVLLYSKATNENTGKPFLLLRETPYGDRLTPVRPTSPARDFLF
jgi:hypothetical protein